MHSRTPPPRLPLASHLEQIRALLRQAPRSPIPAHYQVGVLVSRIKQAEDDHEDGAVTRLATALGWDARTLYGHAAVAECWSSFEIEEIVAQADAAGRLLRWAHLMVVAMCPDAAQRATLIGRVIHERLSVRGVMSVLRAPLAAFPAPHDRARTHGRARQRAANDVFATVTPIRKRR